MFVFHGHIWLSALLLDYYSIATIKKQTKCNQGIDLASGIKMLTIASETKTESKNSYF